MQLATLAYGLEAAGILAPLGLIVLALVAYAVAAIVAVIFALGQRDRFNPAPATFFVGTPKGVMAL